MPKQVKLVYTFQDGKFKEIIPGAMDPEYIKGVIEDMRAAIRRADTIILGLLDFAAPTNASFELRVPPGVGTTTGTPLASASRMEFGMLSTRLGFRNRFLRGIPFPVNFIY